MVECGEFHVAVCYPIGWLLLRSERQVGLLWSERQVWLPSVETAGWALVNGYDWISLDMTGYWILTCIFFKDELSNSKAHHGISMELA